MADHFRLNLYLVEFFARVNANHTTNHLGDNNHVSQVGLHKVGLLVRLGFLFGLAKLLDQAQGATAETAIEPTASAGMDNVTKLFGGKVKEAGFIRTLMPGKLMRRSLLVEIDAAVGELSEGPLSLQLYPSGQSYCSKMPMIRCLRSRV